MKPLTITCRCCKGTGRIEFTGEVAGTLKLLAKQREELSGVDLAKLAGIKPTAMNNRLVALERLGFAVGRTYGRKRFWRVADGMPSNRA